MATQWYVRTDDQDLGPLSSEQLAEMARAGGLRADHWVRTGVTQNWAPASRVKGLHFKSPLSTGAGGSGGAAAGERSAARAPAGNGPVRRSDAVWFLVDPKRSRYGPVTRSEVDRWVAEGRISEAWLIWREGWTDWASAVALYPELDPELAQQQAAASEPEQPNVDAGAKAVTSRGGALQVVQRFICWFTGLEPLQSFKMSDLFSLERAFKRRPQLELDAYFNCGCTRTTPELADLIAQWPHPWFFWRMLVFGVLILAGFCLGWEWHPENPIMRLGVVISGAFFVPLACVSLFFELNILRNISLYQVLKFVLAGGVLSLVIALCIYDVATPLTVLGPMSAGVVEEIAKALTAIVLLTWAGEYPWILNGLLVGAAVGAGFAGFETAGYIASAPSPHVVYVILVLRALLAPFSHVVWTACVVGALWRVKGDRPFRFSMLLEKGFLRVLVFVMLLHILWNSGLLWGSAAHASTLNFAYILGIFSFVGSWYLVLLLVQEGLLQVQAAKDAPPPSLASAAGKASA